MCGQNTRTGFCLAWRVASQVPGGQGGHVRIGRACHSEFSDIECSVNQKYTKFFRIAAIQNNTLEDSLWSNHSSRARSPLNILFRLLWRKLASSSASAFGLNWDLSYLTCLAFLRRSDSFLERLNINFARTLAGTDSLYDIIFGAFWSWIKPLTSFGISMFLRGHMMGLSSTTYCTMPRGSTSFFQFVTTTVFPLNSMYFRWVQYLVLVRYCPCSRNCLSSFLLANLSASTTSSLFVVTILSE